MRFRATSRSAASLHDPRERRWLFMYPRPHRACGLPWDGRWAPPGHRPPAPHGGRSCGEADFRTAPPAAARRFGQESCPAGRKRPQTAEPGPSAGQRGPEAGRPSPGPTGRREPRAPSAGSAPRGPGRFHPGPGSSAPGACAAGRDRPLFPAARCPAAAPTLALRVHLPQQRGVALDVQRQRLHALQVVLHVEREQAGPLPARRRRPRHQLWSRQHHPPAPAAHPPPPPRRPHRARGPCGGPAPFSVFFSSSSSCRRPVALGRPRPGGGERSPGRAGPGRTGAAAPPRGPAGRAPLPAVPPPEQNPRSAPPPLLKARMREALPL